MNIFPSIDGWWKIEHTTNTDVVTKLRINLGVRESVCLCVCVVCVIERERWLQIDQRLCMVKGGHECGGGDGDGDGGKKWMVWYLV